MGKKRGLITLLILILILLLPVIVLGKSSADGQTYPVLNISDCVMVPKASGCQQTVEGIFSPIGRVSSNGHLSMNFSILGDNVLNQYYPYTLCCINSEYISVNTQYQMFKVSLNAPEQSFSGADQILVNSSQDDATVPVSMGDIYESCYLKPANSGCDNLNGEVCLFRVSNSSLNPADWRDVADSGHVADCSNSTIPFNNTFPNVLCCKRAEFCDNGIDDDLDTYIDCADQDCNHLESGEEIEECTNSPYDSDTCTTVMRYENGTNVVTHNINCTVQPYVPQTFNYTYCSYGATGRSATNNEGYCCPEGTFAKFDNLNNKWFCQPRAKCGLDITQYPCEYDYDQERSRTYPYMDDNFWLNKKYNGTDGPDTWCNSQIPYFFSPDVSLSMSTGCCLIAQAGKVDYFTDPTNVKIFGQKTYCGDNVVDLGEDCDGSANGLTCAGINVNNPCPLQGYLWNGTVTCANCLINADCACINMNVQNCDEGICFWG